MSTFDQLKSEVLFNTFDGTKYLEQAGRQVNAAARDIARRSAWGAGEALATVTAIDSWRGAAPTAMARITGVWSTSMTGVRQDRFVFAGDVGLPGASDVPMLRTSAERGCPVYGTRAGTGGATTVVLSPVPASLQILVTGNRLPAPMTTGSDVCELGQDADDALICFARAKLYLREDDKEMHDALMQSYMDELRRFTLTTRPVAEGPRITPGTWGDGSFGGL